MTLGDRIAYSLTLRWVNRQRRKHGDPELDELLLGRPGDAEGCAVSLSVGPGVVMDRVNWRRPGGRLRHVPFWVSNFIRRFDHGHYRHLSLNLKEARELASPWRDENVGGASTLSLEMVGPSEQVFGGVHSDWECVEENDHYEVWERVGTPA
jgi:hypothetical protein